MNEKTESSNKTLTYFNKQKVILIIKKVSKFSLGTTLFVLLSYFFSLLSNVNGKEVSEDYYSNGVPNIIGLLDSELFMGIIFMVTLAVVIYVLYLLWQLHEIAVHRSEKIKSHQANLVFALSLCGLFLHKGWWVLAIIIAFTNWQAIGYSLSEIIRNGNSQSTDNEKG